MIDTTVFQNKTAVYYTLGCKLNFSETSTIGKILREAGVRTARKGEKADICVVNTCSVPEIAGGKVLIKGIAREAGSRTKMAVHSTEVLIDPVGACVGQRGDRVIRVVDELRGEKIDIIKWSENPAEFIANALNPANVREVYTEASGQRSCIVVVPDNQLSLAIGKEGQNARLAAKLTGWKIDIKSQSQYAEQMAAAVPQVEDEEQPAQELPEDFQPYEGVEAPETSADGDDTL